MTKMQMNIKLENTDLQLIQEIAKIRGEGLSDFVRMCLRKEMARLGFLNQKEMKALGVKF